jgi:uncharacterized protein (TIGR00269 family)
VRLMAARMKCRKCGRPAAINMRRHKLSLCGECYPDWFRAQVERTIRRFQMFGRDDRVLVAVSGGKDSLTLWDVLQQLGFQADGLYISLGIPDNDYSTESGEYAARYAYRHGVAFQVVNVKSEYGLSIPEVARLRHRTDKVCSLCGLVKRHIMNRFAYQGGYSVVVTGHNLDDEVAVLTQNTLNWETGYLARQFPVLSATHPKLARKAKPLCLMYERECAAYALVNGIDYIYDECPYSEGARSIFYKELLNQLERKSPGAKAHFFAQFIRAKQRHSIQFLEPEAALLHDCEACGQPTTAPGMCAFCRLWQTRETESDVGEEAV